MKTKVKVSTIYNCSLERAFKTPLLCDVSKIHTGYWFTPRVTHCTEDEHWGRVGSTKKVHVAKSFTQKGGFAFVDKVLERIENKYWRLELFEFQSWLLGFTRFVGEWKTTELKKDEILIEYTYTLHSETPVLFPLQWLFGKILWRAYMRRVLSIINSLAYANEPYLYP